jgi:hypothetical protein
MLSRRFGARRTGPTIRHPYRLQQLLERRDELIEVLQFEYEGRSPGGPEFKRFVGIVAEKLPRTVDLDTLEESLAFDAGRIFDEQTIRTLAHRIMGNLPRLSNRQPVLPWTRQPIAEWVPTQILDCRRWTTKEGRPGALFACKFMAGTPCPRIVTRWWSLKQCAFYSRGFGFARPRSGRDPGDKRFFYIVPEQLVTLRFQALIDPQLSREDPAFAEVEFPKGVNFLGWNKAQIRRRARIGFDCPLGHDLSCQRCWKGYVSCPAGTHRVDYVKRPCPVCQKQDAWFDPDSPAKACVNCQRTYAAELAERGRSMM